MIESNDHMEDAVDILLDLKHDLGKYLLLPLRMLPADASDEAFREALRRALFETRKQGTTVRSGADIWEEFRRELVPFSSTGWYLRLSRDVAAALALADRIPDPALHRPEATEILGRVEIAMPSETLPP